MVTGQAVDNSDYSQHLCKTVLSMSQLGGVVLMGRGGSFILGPERGFHLRVVCPKEKRIENLVKYKQITPEEATQTINESDADRRKFVAHLFDRNIDDPHHYDLVLNSALLDVEEMVETASVAIKAKMSKLTWLDHDQA
jgi:glucuronide carrier protein